MSNSTLYKDEGIVFNEDWANTYVTEVAQLENDDNEMECNDNLSENLNNQNESEDVQQIPAGVTDTLFTATDFLEDNERQNIQPRPHTEQRKVKVTYSDICKSELRRSDRRAAMYVENIFFKTKKTSNENSFGKVPYCS